ncbi:MAG: ferritin-like domain-containing protein [Methylophilaceae bacterium]
MTVNTYLLGSLELRQSALNWLLVGDPQRKVDGVIGLQKTYTDNQVSLDTQMEICVETIAERQIPGRPSKPELVSPLAVKKRSMNTEEGRAALIHALTHIEFNAINLALDAVWRFPDMPEQYYVDWLKVSAEEAYHFSLLNAHLKSFGYEYGSFPGHNALWEMVERTQGDVLARMALVPRTMEARGLDASPPLRNKLAQAGDMAAAEIIDIILRDEIGHVAVGNTWYNWLCEQRELQPITTFEALCKQYNAPKLRPPFNMAARRKAGFSEEELSLL